MLRLLALPVLLAAILQAAVGPGSLGAFAREARSRLCLSALRPLPAYVRRRQHRLPATHAPRGKGKRRDRVRRVLELVQLEGLEERLPGALRRTAAAGRLRPCSRLSTRASFSWTSRSAPSTADCASSCRTSSGASTARPESPPCTSRTTRRRRSSSRTGS